VSEQRISKGRIWKVADHGGLHCRHQLAPFCTEDGEPQNAIAPFVPDTRRGRFQTLVDLDIPARVEFDAAEVSSDAVSVRRPPGGNQKIRTFDDLLAVRIDTANLNSESCAAVNALNFGFQQNLDALVLKQL
jgi:hypothetical protein